MDRTPTNRPLERRLTWLAVALFVWMSNGSESSAGKLGDVSKEVRKPSSSSSSSSSKSSSKNEKRSSHSASWCDDEDDDDDSFVGNLIGGMLNAIVQGTFEAATGTSSKPDDTYRHNFNVQQSVHSETQDTSDAPVSGGQLGGEIYFDEYPGKQIDGYYLTEDWVGDWHSQTDENRADIAVYDWSARLRTDYLYDFDGVERIGSRLRLDHRSRLGLDSTVNYWWETDNRSEWLTTGDANLMYMFGSTKYSVQRIGIGGNWLHDRIGTEGGLNFTFDSEWVGEHLLLGFELDAGWIGSAPTTHYRISTGWQWNRLNFSVGYDYRRFGHAGSIDGLVTGIELWF